MSIESGEVRPKSRRNDDVRRRDDEDDVDSYHERKRTRSGDKRGDRDSRRRRGSVSSDEEESRSRRRRERDHERKERGRDDRTRDRIVIDGDDESRLRRRKEIDYGRDRRREVDSSDEEEGMIRGRKERDNGRSVRDGSDDEEGMVRGRKERDNGRKVLEESDDEEGMIRGRKERDNGSDEQRRGAVHDGKDREKGRKVREESDDERSRPKERRDRGGSDEELKRPKEKKVRGESDDESEDERKRQRSKHESRRDERSYKRDDRVRRTNGSISDDESERQKVKHREVRRETRRRRDGSDDERRSRRDRDRDERSSRGDVRDSRRDWKSRGKIEKEDEKEKAVDGSRLQKLADMQEGMSNLGKTGGVYIPPFKLARMMKEVEDKSSIEYQRLTWDALRKSINGLVNKVNAINIKNIIPELFAENLIRGRGLFCRSCMKSQMASPRFTDVFAALVAVVNTKFPQVGSLLIRRIVLQFKRAFARMDKYPLLAAVKFIAHLVNQQVLHELVALELLTRLLEGPTDDSVEVAVGFVTECGSMLQDLSPRGLHSIFERFRGILHEGEIDKRVQFLIEGLFALRKAKFQGHAAVRPELDLVDLEDQLTHEISLLEEDIDPETGLDIFKPDPQFLQNEKRYEELKKHLLGEESEDEEDNGEESSDDGSGVSSDEEEDDEKMRIRDETETNLINLRRTIYLTIMSSVDFEEAGHKLRNIRLEPGQEMELCIMLLECCSQERTYLRYYGLLGQRFCAHNDVYKANFETCFMQQYSMIHRLETNKLRNVAKFFAHLLGTDALPWNVLSYIRLTEEDTTSSSRIFIKILFQELSEQLGIRLLNEKLNDPTMAGNFESIFPKDNPKNTRFSINFFTSIGLGGITENLREYLRNMPRLIMQQRTVSESEEESDGSDSSSPSEAGPSSSEKSDSESESKRKRGKRRRRHSDNESDSDDRRSKRRHRR